MPVGGVDLEEWLCILEKLMCMGNYAPSLTSSPQRAQAQMSTLFIITSDVSYQKVLHCFVSPLTEWRNDKEAIAIWMLRSDNDTAAKWRFRFDKSAQVSWIWLGRFMMMTMVSIEYEEEDFVCW